MIYYALTMRLLCTQCVLTYPPYLPLLFFPQHDALPVIVAVPEEKTKEVCGSSTHSPFLTAPLTTPYHPSHHPLSPLTAPYIPSPPLTTSHRTSCSPTRACPPR